MGSQRNDIGRLNKNGSKNTRMDFTNLDERFDYRKDELMHIGRYSNAAKTMCDLSKKLGRPIRVLDVGCGEMNTVRLFYRSIICKKSDVLEAYYGVDIDTQMIENATERYGQVYKTCNASYIQRDLTVDPKLDFSDGYFDMIISFEFLEHIRTIYAEPILREISRLLSNRGVALISTPNSNGSNKVLPKDHIYEYSFEELTDMFSRSGLLLEGAYGVCINISKIPKEEKERLSSLIKRFEGAFGRDSAFMSVAIAPLFNPRYCKNVIYHLRRRT